MEKEENQNNTPSDENQNLGKDTEKPQQEVKVSSFFMGKHPITQAQWRVIAALPKIKRDLKLNPSHFKGDHRPVEEVSWYDSVEFCRRLSKNTGKIFRLPSEAEWEYACRAKTNSLFYFGENITHEIANYNGDIGETTIVGKYPPNAFGLYDMHGNVWEWCQDNWNNNYENLPSDGKAYLSGKDTIKIIRGGCWFRDYRYCRSAYRGKYEPNGASHSGGFRVVCVIQ